MLNDLRHFHVSRLQRIADWADRHDRKLFVAACIIVAAAFALSGCNPIVVRSEPFPQYERNSLADRMNPNRTPPYPTLTDDLTLYVSDMTEVPETVRVPTADGMNLVQVYKHRCAPGAGTDAATIAGDWNTFTVYLCFHPDSLYHEVIGHGSKMTHTDWESCGLGKCAKVINPGYKTRYRAGDWLIKHDGSELIERDGQLLTYR